MMKMKKKGEKMLEEANEPISDNAQGEPETCVFCSAQLIPDAFKERPYGNFYNKSRSNLLPMTLLQTKLAIDKLLLNENLAH